MTKQKWLVALLAITFVGSCFAITNCPGGTQTTIVYGNGVGTTWEEAQQSLTLLITNLDPQFVTNNWDQTCFGAAVAYDSRFPGATSNAILSNASFALQIADALSQLGIDYTDQFWNYWNGLIGTPDWLASLQSTLILAATSIYQPDLLTQEAFYTSELLSGHKIIVVAHSQGNLYANQAYAVVTSFGGADRFHIVAVATPASSVGGGGAYVTLHGDIITAALDSLAPNITNDPPSPCPGVDGLAIISSGLTSEGTTCHSFDDSYMGALEGGDKTRPAILNAVLGYVQQSSSGLLVDDMTTAYGIGIQPGSAGCYGGCDLSPSYNNYRLSTSFNISKITFRWSNSGGNNCDGIGHYAAFISSGPNADGIIASSTNSIYVGCVGFGGGASGTGELDFSGETIPASFYLDFASVDGGLQGGAAVTISDVQIWQVP